MESGRDEPTVEHSSSSPSGGTRRNDPSRWSWFVWSEDRVEVDMSDNEVVPACRREDCGRRAGLRGGREDVIYYVSVDDRI